MNPKEKDTTPAAQNAAAQSQASATAPEKSAEEKARARLEKVKTVISSFMTTFYGRQGAAAISAGELWDLRKTPRGGTVELYNLDSQGITQWAIPVSKHVKHMKPAIFDGLLKTWQELIDSGVLRS